MSIKQNATDVFDAIPSSGLLLPPMATPLSGDIHTWTEEMYVSADKASSIGFWKASVGRSHWDFADYTEAVLVLSGRLIATEEGGEPVEFGPGDAAVFPLGWKGEWDVVEELRKFYAIFPA